MGKLFSYGTLQLEQVQLETFGRTLLGYPDSLKGYKKEIIKIKVASVVNLSGIEEHIIISYSGRDSDIIEGLVFSVTRDELDHADAYETNDYRRIEVVLQSGRNAWVYVKSDK